MKAAKLIFIIVTISLTLVACGKPKNKVAVEQAKPGRDSELFKNGVSEIVKGHEDTGRILLQTIMNTYPDSPLVKTSKLAIADSFYLEGGSKNLAQAEAGYREFLQFFPNDPLADSVMLKIADIHMRQVIAPDRDTTHARAAERELKELLKLHPDTSKKQEVEARMQEVQEYLAMHELKVALFYYTMRQAPIATEQRTAEILKNYPNFSRMDEALYYHAKAMADQEDTETASVNLTQLVKEYPHSQFEKAAAKLLADWKKPVPEPDPAKVAEKEEHKGVVPRFMGFVFGPKVANISSKGVIIDQKLPTDQIVAMAQKLSGLKVEGTPDSTVSTNKPSDTRARRSTQAGQDVEVKPGSPVNSKDKDKKKNDSSKPAVPPQ